ncbi:MAG: hypothetical protein M1838_004129 [Thelocarpon superellum]|nr:MAG: hypothetical protein M1838_004129 [Thelocarpon superellum]
MSSTPARAAAESVHLPNGQTVSVTQVFGGSFFKPNDLNTHHAVLPPGWTIQIHTEDEEADHDVPWREATVQSSNDGPDASSKKHVHRFKSATLRHDSLFISSISNPSSTDFKPATSPTRQLAMMLWTTLYWYFHHPEPDLRLRDSSAAKTAESGKPKGEWRVRIKREGVFRGKHLLAKLERMGLIASEDSSVGLDVDERAHGDGWQDMFVSRRSFWQLDARIYLFTLSPTLTSPFPSSSPYPSRPSSPNNMAQAVSRPENQGEATVLAHSQGLWAPSMPGPYVSASHLPTYFPPPPLQYTFTNHVRHPVRPKPPRQGEVFYTRHIPSVGQYLSFRVASLSPKPPAHLGPSVPAHVLASRPTSVASVSELNVMNTTSTPPQEIGPSDVELLEKWMNEPRVARFWGEQGPLAHQESLLKAGLQNRHSFPVMACWDGKPFGYFELYWVKEDHLGRHLDGGADNWDRGIHGLVGEQEFRGPHRVPVWVSALIHYCFLADNRTQSVLMEPRVDNEKYGSQEHRCPYAR